MKYDKEIYKSTVYFAIRDGIERFVIFNDDNTELMFICDEKCFNSQDFSLAKHEILTPNPINGEFKLSTTSNALLIARYGTEIDLVKSLWVLHKKSEIRISDLKKIEKEIIKLQCSKKKNNRNEITL